MQDSGGPRHAGPAKAHSPEMGVGGVGAGGRGPQHPVYPFASKGFGVGEGGGK